MKDDLVRLGRGVWLSAYHAYPSSKSKQVSYPGPDDPLSFVDGVGSREEPGAGIALHSTRRSRQLIHAAHSGKRKGRAADEIYVGRDVAGEPIDHARSIARSDPRVNGAARTR